MKSAGPLLYGVAVRYHAYPDVTRKDELIMKITMGCVPAGNAVRLQLDVTGPTPEAALREVTDQAQRFAIEKGISHVFYYTHEQMIRRIDAERADRNEAMERLEAARQTNAALHVQRDALQAEVSKLAERRDRWRKRAETAGELAAEMRSQRDAARDEAAQARRKAMTEAADSLERDVKMFDGIFGVGVLHAVGRLRGWAGRVPVSAPNAGVNFEVKPNPTNAPNWQGRTIVEVPDPTPCAESSTDRDLLAAILAAVEAIRDDLASMGQIR